MRFVAVDWGTSRLRAVLVDGETALARAASDEGISRLSPGGHRAAFDRLCGAWLAADPAAMVALAGMVGSREGWWPAPYVSCPAGAEEVAAATVAADLGEGRRGFVVPGLRCDDPGGVDVMRGEETLLLGSGVQDGLVCLPGTHSKWAEMRGGRIVRFASFVTGELHALLREHSMVGRPAREPADAAGFGLGLDAATAEPRSLLNHLFRARAATVTGRLAPEALGPYLSGLLTGEEVAGALRLFGTSDPVTIIAGEERGALYAEALGRLAIPSRRHDEEAAFLTGVGRIIRNLDDDVVGAFRKDFPNSFRLPPSGAGR